MIESIRELSDAELTQLRGSELNCERQTVEVGTDLRHARNLFGWHLGADPLGCCEEQLDCRRCKAIGDVQGWHLDLPLIG
ncbi:MAG: hypothetical protein P8P69_11210 [Ilumatobacter sp.]|nr:hypothetical protein [Ilumatobacter sp.]MDG1784561.1 hypothetical protein [Ilumatobacter sp.]